jgi:ABC-type multidrug transport system ATPase subunit
MDAITVENGTFTWETKDESETDKNPEIPVGNTLIDINLHVPKGSLVAVVGTVGSGKSSLISALLGEMDRVMGRVNINGSSKVAYVSQQAWIQNATLKQNILFGMKYDRQKYDSVINACALSPDLAILPGGDETEIGEKGINLSGGQKQRVAIARACYSDSDIVLLDDPLSAVDSHVAKHIFEKVLSNKKGVLKDKTRLLITNNLNFLSEVDSIVVLKNGRINEIGTYDELMENKGDFCEFINEFSSDRKESNGPLLARQESVISDKFSRSLSVEKEKEVENQTKLIENEKTETGKVKFSVYVRYFKSLTWIWLFFLLLGMIGMQIASVGSNVWLALWSSDKPRNGTQDIELRNMRLGVYGALGAAQGFTFLFYFIFSISMNSIYFYN